ncbi:MAG: hypothetical protein JKY15_06720 [Deltaproteobacteria bacterium]|nr:hypothetical protein [Deltaproteobacteria bacterium]
MVYKLFHQEGPTCLEKLVGDFAFAIWDPQKETLFAARDQMGQRLIYYTIQPGKFFAFSTVISGLLALEQIGRKINNAKVNDFLNLSCSNPEQTFFDDLFRLEPGQYLEFKDGNLQLNSYWSLDNINPVRFGKDEDYLEAFREIFDKAVQSRLRSLYPVGAHLSGGLDSSSVVAMAVKNGRPMTTFSAFPPVGYQGPTRPNWNLDDTHYIESMSSYYPNLETVILRSENRNLFSGLDATYPYLDAPCLNPCNRIWIDEIFEEALNRDMRVLLIGMTGNATISWKGQTFKQRLGWWARAPKRFLKPSRWDMKDPRHWMIMGGLIQETLSFFQSERAYWGVEFRDPTHDKRLVEFCLGLPNAQYARQNTNRMLVRRAMRGLLPELIRIRKDQGAQLAQWPQVLQESYSQIKKEWSKISIRSQVVLGDYSEQVTRWIETWPQAKIHSHNVLQEYRRDFLRAFFMARWMNWNWCDGTRRNKRSMDLSGDYPNHGH